MPTDMQTTKDLDGSLISSALGTNAAAKAVQSQKRTRLYNISKLAADGMASTATADTTLPWKPVLYAGRVTAVRITPSAALTGDPTNNAILTFSKRDAAGANLTTVAVLTTTASWVAGVQVVVPVTTTNAAVVAGGSVSVAITKGGSGVVVPISDFTLAVEDT